MIFGFKIVNDTINLNVEEILKYPKLSIIYKRDKSTNKEIAHKEFLYINFLADKQGVCAKKGYSKKEAHLFAVRNSKLIDGYTPDREVKEAIEFIEDELNVNIVEDLINSTLKGLNISRKIVDTLIEEIGGKVNESKFVTTEMLATYDKAIKEFMKIAADIPNKISSLTDLLENYNKFESGTSKIRGGKEHRSSYDGYDDQEFVSSSSVERLS